jgi:hypothetical protein
MKLLFEPWGLGDACIAAAVAIHGRDCAVACRSAWHPLIEAAVKKNGKEVRLIEASVAYGVRFIEKNEANQVSVLKAKFLEVLSIRGDFRDYIWMVRQYHDARIRMCGWLIWLSRRILWVDFLIRKMIPVRSRYVQWANFLGIESDSLGLARPWPDQVRQIGIHIGAQWRSKQYPHVAALLKILRENNCSVLVFAGEKDTLPDGLQDHEVVRAMGADLISQMGQVDLMITNDSGPMHACYLSGIPFLAIFGTANAQEWAPPGARYLSANFMPSGYKSAELYATDDVLPGWPSADDIFSLIQSNCDLVKQ